MYRYKNIYMCVCVYICCNLDLKLIPKPHQLFPNGCLADLVSDHQYFRNE